MSHSLPSPPPPSLSVVEEEDEHDILTNHTHGRYTRSLGEFPLPVLILFELDESISTICQHPLPPLPPISRGSAGPAGGVQSPDGGDGGDEVDAGPPQRQLPVMAALCGGAEMFRLL